MERNLGLSFALPNQILYFLTKIKFLVTIFDQKFDFRLKFLFFFSPKVPFSNSARYD